MIQIEKDPGVIRTICDEVRAEGKTVGFVPTMGALHEGHLRLVDRAIRQSDFVLVSIFVNPTQFGPNEDFEKYPRNLSADAAMLEKRGVRLIFAPDAADMYPAGSRTEVVVSKITEPLCGAHRQGHFAGVATIVTKFFNIVGPCVSVFGRKDYQQLQVIKSLACDLNMPVVVDSIATVREPDGLAKSSRNAYLSDAERTRALQIPAALKEAHRLFSSGANAVDVACAVRERIEGAADRIDYVSVLHPDSLEAVDATATHERLLVAIACFVGKTRLIDNTVLGEDVPPH